MLKQNCWEFKPCGREPGGLLSTEYGVCPAAIQMKAEGVNGGVMGGRVCWVIAGTFCHDEIQGTSATKMPTCFKCEFYRLVKAEEGEDFEDGISVLKLIYSCQ